MRLGLAQQLVLLLPAGFLALSVDRILPERRPAPLVMDVSWEEAAPTLPGVTEGAFGRPGRPLAVVFAATPSSLRAALSAAGWTSVPTSLRGALAAGMLPMSDERLIGRRQNMNWTSPAGRLRLWFTGEVDPDGRAYWWGALDGDRGALVASLAGSRYLDSSRPAGGTVAFIALKRAVGTSKP